MSARPIDGILDALDAGGWFRQANATDTTRWVAQCPAHPDGTPSLSLREVDDGRVLVHCFAGCGTADVLAALRLDWPDLFPEGSRSEAVRQKARRSAGLSALFDALGAYLHLPDPDHVLFSLAVATSASLGGEPLWGLIVGPPSSGKTEVVRMLDLVADDHLSEITAAGLLSWVAGRKPRKTGLLARVGDVAFATIGDLSTLLAMSDRGQRDVLFALLRRAYDGNVVRELGNAPEPLRWQGRLTLLAAVTPAVDRYSAHADALGPRWLYFRLPGSSTVDRRVAARMARETGGRLADYRHEVAVIARQVVEAAGCEAQTLTLPAQVTDAIDDVALVACLGRAAVEREGYGRREISAMPVVEEPPRITAQMALLARGLLALGIAENEVVRLCRKAGLDSMPQARRRALTCLAEGQELPTAEVARRVGCDRKVARFALEELAAVGVCRYRGDDADEEEPTKARKWWRIDGADATLVAAVVQADARSGTKSRFPPPNPPNKEGDQTGAPHTSSHFGERAA